MFCIITVFSDCHTAYGSEIPNLLQSFHIVKPPLSGYSSLPDVVNANVHKNILVSVLSHVGDKGTKWCTS